MLQCEQAMPQLTTYDKISVINRCTYRTVLTNFTASAQ